MERKVSLGRTLSHGPVSTHGGLSFVMATFQRDTGISWSESTARVSAYWRTLGVNDEEQLTALTRRVMQRVDALEPETSGDLAMFAVAETRRLLDEWLVAVLGDDKLSAEQLAMARVALLSGAVPEWPAALLAGGDHRALADALHKAVVAAVPAPAELSMVTQRIDLFSFAACCRYCLQLLWTGLAKLVKRLGRR